MPSVLREALSAAEYFVNGLERGLDERIGRSRRQTLARYVGLLSIGVPFAWLVQGLHWTVASTGGLIAGIFLYGAIDIARSVNRRKTPAKGPRT